MKLPSVYPLTRPSSHSTSRITAIVKSILPPRQLQSTVRAPLRCPGSPAVVRFDARLYVAGYVPDWFRMSRMTYRRSSILILSLSLLLTAAPQAPMDTSLFSCLRARSIGPSRGGRSQTAAGTVARPLEYYFGATGGGV